MGRPANKPATYQDVLDAPSHRVAEILNGELHLRPRPSPRHSRACLRLGVALERTWLTRGGDGGPPEDRWQVLVEPELHLAGDVLVPDLAGWRLSTLPELPETAWFELRPDWLCEILSPSTQRIDRGRKMTAYAEAGVPWMWLVDPLARLLEVYQLEAPHWRRIATHEGAAIVRAEPFSDLEIELSLLWD